MRIIPGAKCTQWVWLGQWLSLVTTVLWLAELTEALGDDTFVYAVQISAQLQSSPPAIILSWKPDPYGATNYTIFRKAKEDTTWGAPIANLAGTALSFTDTNVAVGSSFEYQIIKAAQLGYTGYGYIFSGIKVPLVESRGSLVLLVASESMIGLDAELSQLENDLVADGWSVLRHNVSINDSPDDVRNLILTDFRADPDHVNTVFLLGHVPVLQSGNLDYDGHGARPMPADAFYGDVFYDWPTAPGSSPSYLPSYIPLAVGRVDFANMPGIGAPTPWPTETELLRRYLAKDHAWRLKNFTVQRRALMGNRRGDEGGLAVAASGYRNFEPLVGPGNTIEANIADVAPAAQRWSSMLAASNYLWAYGCGAGLDSSISFLGTNDPFQQVWSTDIVGQDAKAVFVMVFGSHFGNWDHTDNIMRSVLATPGVGLACFMSGVPHWFCHHMGLGETIGYSTRLSLNNSTLYRSYTNPFTQAVYIALMGDPTLRMEPVSPPASLSATTDSSGVQITWGISADIVAGYNVYRASSSSGPFTRLNSALLTETGFRDAPSPPGAYTYMVRAVALTSNPSGSYYNASQGLFTSVAVASPANPIIQATRLERGLTLSWNSQPGATYHVDGTSNLNASTWTNLSGPLSATGTFLSWTDPDISLNLQRFFRVVSP